jgi:hypothetical protein
MDFKLTSRIWTVEVSLGPGEAPDVGKSYTDMTFRPAQVKLTFTQDSGQDARCTRYEVTGPRVLKGGRLGHSLSDAGYGLPEDGWLLSVVADAQMRCAGLDEGDS